MTPRPKVSIQPRPTWVAGSRFFGRTRVTRAQSPSGVKSMPSMRCADWNDTRCDTRSELASITVSSAAGGSRKARWLESRFVTYTDSPSRERDTA